MRVIASPNRELVVADVTIEPVNQGIDALFELAGPLATAGETLRPVHPFEAQLPDLSFSIRWRRSPDANPVIGFSINKNLDRFGHFREIEIIFTTDLTDVRHELDYWRAKRTKPPLLDGSPCQVSLLDAVIG